MMLKTKHLCQIKLITIQVHKVLEEKIMQTQDGKARVFSIELKSKRNLKNVTLTNNSADTVLLE